MPDYPKMNPEGLSYPRMLYSLVMLYRHPLMIQMSLIGFLTGIAFTDYWTTLSFLLSGSPYFYSSIIIGLFALLGLSGVCGSPLWARYITDRYVPLFTVLTGQGWMLFGILFGTFTGTFTVAGPIVQAIFLDLGMTTSAIASRAAVYQIDLKATNRINTGYIIFAFLGQLVGAIAGTRAYTHGGWHASGGLAIGAIGLGIILTLVRGPYEIGWIGWRGGVTIRKKDRTTTDGRPTDVTPAMSGTTTPATTDLKTRDEEQRVTTIDVDIEKNEKT